MKRVGFIAWRPFIEDNKYYKEWINEQIVSQIDEINSVDELWYISSCKLLGCIEDYKNFQFYFCEVINKKHIFSLNFKNFRFFLENILPKFDVIVTSQPHYPFIMLLNKYAKKYGVKTVFIQHGMQVKNESSVVKERLNILRKKQSLVSSIALIKQLFMCLKIDYKVSILTIKNILSKSNALFFPEYLPKEYRFDYLKVYSQEEYNKYITKYNKESVEIILDPDIKLYLNYSGKKYTNKKKYVLYIDDKVIKDYNQYKKFNKLVDFFNDNNYDFFYLPRARNDEQPEYDKLNKKIIFLPPRSINEYIDNAEFIISNWSTLLNLPLYLKKKILIPYDENIIKYMKEKGYYQKFKNSNNVIFLNLQREKEWKSMLL